MSRLKEEYFGKAVPALMEAFGYKNVLAVPRIEKVVVNVGVGQASKDAKLLDLVIKEISLITGQKPAVRRATKSVAGFGIRQGQPVGCKVTLRGRRMYEFLERLIDVAIPRIRDFRGLSVRCFDGRGNYNLGLTEQTVFPEVPYDQVEALRGLCISIVIPRSSDEASELLLRRLGMPFTES